MSDLLCLHVQQQQQQQLGRVRRRSASERLRSREADSRRGDEKQTLSAACREPAIFHFRLVFVLPLLRTISSISRLPGAWTHSSRQQRSGVGTGRREPGRMQGTIRRRICAISPHLCLLLSFISAHFLRQQPENGVLKAGISDIKAFRRERPRG